MLLVSFVISRVDLLRGGKLLGSGVEGEMCAKLSSNYCGFTVDVEMNFVKRFLDNLIWLKL